MSANPRNVRLLGQLELPAERRLKEPATAPTAVDADTDVFGAEAAAARLDVRIARPEPQRAVRIEDGRAVLVAALRRRTRPG